MDGPSVLIGDINSTPVVSTPSTKTFRIDADMPLITPELLTVYRQGGPQMLWTAIQKILADSQATANDITTVPSEDPIVAVWLAQAHEEMRRYLALNN